MLAALIDQLCQCLEAFFLPFKAKIFLPIGVPKLLSFSNLHTVQGERSQLQRSHVFWKRRKEKHCYTDH